MKREEILYKNFVAYCKANPAVCLQGMEIESTHFINSKTKNSKTHVSADALNFPNRPWLRSFRLVWGLGRKKTRETISTMVPLPNS